MRIPSVTSIRSGRSWGFSATTFNSFKQFNPLKRLRLPNGLNSLNAFIDLNDLSQGTFFIQQEP
jgi:hypothetical protein